MTTWIRGRFEGTYVGRIVPQAGAAAMRDMDSALHISSIRLERGIVREPESVDAPPVAQTPTPNWIRQRTLTQAMFPPEEGEVAWRSVPIFDLRVVDWKLVSPAESDGRAFGTVLGTLYARLTPQESEERATGDAEALPPPPPTVKTEAKKQDANEEEPKESEEPLGVGWWLTIVATGILTVGLGILCGAPTGLLWGAAMAIALLLRRTLKVQEARDHLVWRLCGIAIIGGHLALSWAPVNAWYEIGCKPALGERMLWLALPVVLAALLPRKLTFVFTALIWTVLMFSWCDELKGATCALRAVVASEAPVDDVTPRVDPMGRWPRRPGGGRMPRGAFDVGDARASRLPGSTPGIVFPPLPTDFAGGPRDPGGPMGGDGLPDFGAGGDGPHTGSRLPDVFPEHDLERPVGEGRATNGEADAGTRPSDVDAGQPGAVKRTADPASPSPAGGGKGDLLSLDQVAEAPERFFEARGAMRIYIPTDAYFGADGETIYESQSGELGVLASLLRQYSGRIAIEVHTDSRRGPKDMARLAQLRANAVLQWLTRHEVEASRLVPIGIGSLNPLVPPLLHRVHQSANRRLEIRLLP